MENEVVASQLMKDRILWLGLTTPILFYVIAAQSILSQPGAGETLEQSALLKAIFYTLAISFAAASVLLRRFFLSESRIKQLRAQGSVALADNTPEQKAKTLALLISRWTVTNLLSWALNEATALLGFCLALACHDLSLIWPFVGLAVVMNIVTFPRFDALQAKAGL